MLRNFDRRIGHIVGKELVFFLVEHFPLQISFISCHVTEIKVLCVQVQVQKSESLVEQEQDPVSNKQKTGKANYSSFLESKRVPPWM